VTGDGTVSLGKKGNPMTGEKSTMDGLGELARVARKNDPVLRLDGTKRKKEKLLFPSFSNNFYFINFLPVLFFFLIKKLSPYI
jgi:hypothetical protein